MGLITDVGSALQDEIDYIFLAGATGLHNRFGNLYTLVNGNLEVTNLKSTAVTGSGTKVVLQTGATIEYPTFTKGFSVVQPSLITNGRLTLSAGVLKLVGDDGNDPSATNPVYFTVPHTTAGRWRTITFTSTTHCTIQDLNSADSYFNGGGGTTFGTTSIVAWGNAAPFAIYVSTDGTTPVLFLSRNPTATTTPSSTGIGYKDTPPSSQAQTNFFAWSATDVTSTHASKPCWLIGSIRMTKNSSDNWAITTLDNGDGLGNYYNFGARIFTMPTGQNGADITKYVSTNGGGTAPAYDSVTFQYILELNGLCLMSFALSNSAGGTPGVGANNLQISGPYIALDGSGTQYYWGSGQILNSGAISTNCNILYLSGALFVLRYQTTIVTALTTLTAAGQDQVTRSISASILYKAFGS